MKSRARGAEESGAQKVGQGMWGEKCGTRILRKVWRLMLDEKSGGEKTGTRKVETGKVGREKWDKKSGARKVGCEKWSEKSRAEESGTRNVM